LYYNPGGTLFKSPIQASVPKARPPVFPGISPKASPRLRTPKKSEDLNPTTLEFGENFDNSGPLFDTGSSNNNSKNDTNDQTVDMNTPVPTPTQIFPTLTVHSVKSPSKDSYTQTPRSVEIQTDPPVEPESCQRESPVKDKCIFPNPRRNKENVAFPTATYLKKLPVRNISSIRRTKPVSSTSPKPVKRALSTESEKFDESLKELQNIPARSNSEKKILEKFISKNSNKVKIFESEKFCEFSVENKSEKNDNEKPRDISEQNSSKETKIKVCEKSVITKDASLGQNKNRDLEKPESSNGKSGSLTTNGTKMGSKISSHLDIFKYFDSSINIPDYENIEISSSPSSEKIQKVDEKLEILEEKEIIKEVDESVYHGNETFILPAETEIEPIIQNIIENIIIHPRSSRSNSVVSKCSDALTEKVTEITDKVRPLN
jgi:hypothetical protein